MLNFQQMIATLTEFWANQGCAVHQGYDLEVGAGTFNPVTFLRCLGPEPYNAVYVEPSRRPQDGRYGENPNRVQFYHQMQVIFKPSPIDIKDLYLKSLEAIGLKLHEHDIRFVHDDWENPTIGAWGLGWEVWIDGMEVTQFTYFQSVGGLPVKPVSGEITYGLERLAMYIQNVDSFFDLRWNDTLFYGDIFKRSEWEWSHYNFNEANTAMWHRHFDDFERECKELLAKELPIPAYDFVIKASHAFNIMEARGILSVTERTGYITRIRNLAKQIAETYIKSRKEQEFPLLKHAPSRKEERQLEALSHAAYNPSEREDFLLEIGSEELPATFIPLGLKSLEHKMTAWLKEHRLPFTSISTYGTPRRLAVLVKGLAAGTAATTHEKKGPGVSLAFDATGHPTREGAGFFRAVGKEPHALKEIRSGKAEGITIKEKEGAEYLYAVVETPGQSTRHLLARDLAKLILSIDFPKKMRWGDLDIEYARPLRWLVALYGSDIIPFSLAGLHAGRKTIGHTTLSPGHFNLAQASSYVEELFKHKIDVDIDKRKLSILEQISQIERELKGKVIEQEKVLSQVLYLAEWPLLAAAPFDPIYLQVPKEVAISEMIEHQKYFPVADAKGNLLPFFVITCNNAPSPAILKGNQMALIPRLADGMFHFTEDLKIPLEKFNEKLKNITFRKELGSLHDKVERIKNNVALLHSYLPLTSLPQLLRAAALCKADLATDLVGEFPELQGVIGRLYALKQGEAAEVALAIDEHWMPRGEKSPLPQSPLGTLLSIADKTDNLLSCFSLGLLPTSSSDPYSLRRQTLGIIKMVIQGKHYLPFLPYFKKAFSKFVEKLEPAVAKKIANEEEKILQEIQTFFQTRLHTVFSEMNFGKDEIEAVLSKGFTDLYDSYRLLSELHEFRKNKELFSAVSEIHTRVTKILHSQIEERYPPVDAVLFESSVEKKLFDKIEEVKREFHLAFVDRRTTQERDYKGALRLLSHLQGPLNTFFEEVKVLTEDRQKRTNRLALLQEISDLTSEIADFSKMQG